MDTQLGGHIADAAADVYEQLGSGLSEAIYQKAMAIALRARGCDVDTEVVVPIVYLGAYVGFVRPDLVINKQVVLELKAVTRIVEAHLVQLRAYMRWLPPKPVSYATIDSKLLGAVINFGGSRVELKPAELDVLGEVD